MQLTGNSLLKDIQWLFLWLKLQNVLYTFSWRNKTISGNSSLVSINTFPTQCALSKFSLVLFSAACCNNVPRDSTYINTAYESSSVTTRPFPSFRKITIVKTRPLPPMGTDWLVFITRNLWIMKFTGCLLLYIETLPPMLFSVDNEKYDNFSLFSESRW